MELGFLGTTRYKLNTAQEFRFLFLMVASAILNLNQLVFSGIFCKGFLAEFFKRPALKFASVGKHIL